MSDQDTAPQTADQPGSTLAEKQRLQLIQQLEQLRRTIDKKLNDPAFIDQVAEAFARRVLGSGALEPLLDRLLDARFARILSSHYDHAHHPSDAPRIVGLRAILHRPDGSPVDGMDLKVVQNPADHPTDPMLLQFYLRDQDGRWGQKEIGELAKESVLTAIRETDGFEPGRFYWVEFYQITDRPTGGEGEQRLDSNQVATTPVHYDDPAAETHAS